MDLFRTVVDATTDYAIFVLDPDGIIKTWNAGAQRINGYTADEVIGRHFSIFSPQSAIDADHPAEELRLAGAAGRHSEEGWRIRKGGSRFWAHVTITALRDDRGTLHGFAKIVRDATERKSADDAVRLAEQQFRYAFDAAPTGMALLAPHGRWLRVNDSLCRLTGWSREDLLRGTLQQLLEPSDPGRGLQHIQDLLLSEDINSGTETRIVRADGTPIWVQLNVGVVRRDDGGPLHLVAQIEDIDGRVAAVEAQQRAVQEYAAANAVLRDAERAKAHFLAMASHELRSPLTAILGYADILRRRWNALDDDRKLQSVATIERQARRLNVLVEDLLILSSIEANGLSLDRRPVPLRELLGDIRSMIVDDPPELDGDLDVVVDADPLRLEQIITNLVTNAQKYGAPPYLITVRETTAAVRLEVRDHGPGVPPEFVSHLFERFTQADEGPTRRSHGVGLGLAICRALADAHGATLTYESAEGGGACFVVSLPR